MFPLLLLVSLCTALCALLYVNLKKPSSDNYFPGPPSEPILGHIRRFPQDSPWVKFAEWGKQYGKLRSLLIRRL